MPESNLELSSLDSLLENAQGLTTVGSSSQIKSILAVIAKSALVVNDGVQLCSEEIKCFNKSTTDLTKKIISLNRILTAATVILALATIISVVNLFL